MSFFYQITDGIRITARPSFAPEHSDPGRAQFVFVYQIRIENVGASAARLTDRHWRIHDPIAGDQEVDGAGVVGEQPLLEPGEVYEYRSYCVLRGPHGAMDGHYRFQRVDGSTFVAAIPRFTLEA